LLKPAAMQRVAIVGRREERQRVVSLLYDLGVVQIEPLSKSVASVLKAETDNAASKDVSEELLRIRSLMSALPPMSVGEKRGFASLAELIDVSKSISIDKDVAALKQRQEKLGSRLDELRSRTALVHNLEFIDADLSVLDLESASAFFGTLSTETYERMRNDVSPLSGVMIQTSGTDKQTDTMGTVVVVPRSELEKFGAIIQAADIKLERIPPMKGRPSEVLSALESERVQAELDLQKVNDGLREIAERYYGTLSVVDEQLSIEARVLEVIGNVGFTESSFVLEGWVPLKKLQSLKDALTHQSNSTILFEIAGESKPPTLMENPKSLKFFESFTRVLTPPQWNEFDPTLIFALVFPIFFGLMLGDVGYGIVILGISLWIKRRVEHPGGKTVIPAALRRFGRSIFQPVQFRKLAMAMMPGAVLGIVFGFIFNAYFGFQLNQYAFTYLNDTLHLNLPAYLTQNGAFLDPITSRGLRTLLLFSGYTGLFFVSLGLVMGMINKYWMDEKRHIIGKVGWLSVAWGLSLYGLLVLHSHELVADAVGGIYIGLVVAGVALIAYGDGAGALIELPSIVSHILSFTRLTGILLASVGFALVVNSQFEGLAGPLFMGGERTALAIVFAVAGIVILVAGQMFIIVLALFEPGIQGARLLFVEYFSKFYEGQARLFAPFKGKRTYTLSQIQLLESKGHATPVLATPQLRKP
jgi:V/A-type H+/Na+-transporting ATPase subunit I